jgi:hypothetical protein
MRRREFVGMINFSTIGISTPKATVVKGRVTFLFLAISRPKNNDKKEKKKALKANLFF